MLERCTQQAKPASLAEELFNRFQAAVEQLDSEKDLCKERRKVNGEDGALSTPGWIQRQMSNLGGGVYWELASKSDKFAVKTTIYNFDSRKPVY